MNIDYINVLYQRYLNGTLSAAQREEWLDLLLNPDYEDYLKYLMGDDFENIPQEILIDIEKKRNSKILSTIIKQRSAIIPVWKRTGFQVTATVAAMIIFLIGIELFIDGNKNYKTEVDHNKEIAFSPVGNSAVLTLGDGQQIDLSKISTGQIANRSGIHITKSDDGSIVYDTSETDGNVETHTIEAPAGGQWQVILPDKSKVWLNAMSKISYPTRFTGGQRIVHISGEAYFEIAHDKLKPFKVITGTQTIEVLGTHFNVTAYPDEHFIRTTLLEGSVKISDKGSSLLLKPGQQSLNRSNSLHLVKNADIEEVISWKNGYFKFNEDLESIMNKIARWYNVEVEYEYMPLEKLSFAGEISRKRELKEVLKTMEYSGKIHFKIKGRRIIVTR